MSHDRIAALKAHNRLIESLDREIADDADPYEIAEKQRQGAARARWGNLPSARTPPGTRTARMTDAQVFHADQQDR